MKKIIYIFLMLVLVGCGSKKDSVTVYTVFVEGDTFKNIVETFNKKHPKIEVKFIASSITTLRTRLLSEGKNTSADVVVMPVDMGLLKLLKPYKSSHLNEINSDFIDREVENNPRWVGLAFYSSTIVVNKKLMKEKGLVKPKSFKDLINDVYKGNVVMPNPLYSGTGYQTISNILYSMKISDGFDFIDQLDKNIANYTSSGSAPISLVQKGEYPMGIAIDFAVMEAVSNDPNLEIIFPSDFLPYNFESVALIDKKNMNPNGKIFYDWLLSEDGFREVGKARAILTSKKVKSSMKNVPDELMDRFEDIAYLKWMNENVDSILLEWKKRYNK